jgi:hypothetical protein
VLDTPEDAARALLQLLHGHLQAIAHGDRKLADRYRDRVARDVAARDDILARYRSVAGRFAQEESRALAGLIENWAAIIAYYADGLELDRMKRGAASLEAGRAVVDVPARGPEDRAVIRVACLRDKQAQWRATGIELVPPEIQAHRAPTTRPAADTQPGTAPVGGATP